MSSSRKKAIIRTLTGTLQAGYLPLTGLVTERGKAREIDLLDLEGRIVPIPLANVRSVAYVRDFNLGDRDDPERLSRRTFLARPRTEGLWVRLTMLGSGLHGNDQLGGGLHGGDLLEGLAPLDLALIDGLLEDHGIFLIPPDIRSNTQRLYIPRSAFTSIQLLAVITTPSKSKPTPPDAQPGSQLDPQPSLFPRS